MHDPYYWHFRCPQTGLLRRVDLPGVIGSVAEDKAAEILSGKVPLPKFPCEDCGSEHEGYLERSKFGAK